MERDHQQDGYQRKVWVATGIVALTVVTLLLLTAIFNVLLMVFFGILVAVYFHSLKHLIHRKTAIPEKGSLAISVFGSILILAGFFYLAGDRIAAQSDELAKEFPEMVRKVKEDVEGHPIGSKVMDQLTADDSGDQLQAFAERFFSGTFGVVGDVYILIILALFFTTAPSLYVNGAIKLIPKRSRERAREVFHKLGYTLGKWLKGMLVAMLFVALLTGIGLVVLDIRAALFLALIAGLLNFIPNFGPLIAAVPAVLIAMLAGPTVALMVFGLYVITQVLESTLVQPQLQKKLIHMPPALIIIAQLTMGVFSGALGLILATPLVAVIMVVVEELHVKRQDGLEV
jgi:predicted PurR-regulated permease PerM